MKLATPSANKHKAPEGCGLSKFETSWPRARLSSLLVPTARAVRIEASRVYHPLGVRSHGRGLFRKEELPGSELGISSFFWVKAGDFVFSQQFAWEGAVALASDEHSGCVVTHRFPIYRTAPERLVQRYLLYFFKTQFGSFLLDENSRGAAGRNRPLSTSSLMKEEIPVPPLPTQKAIANFLDRKTAAIDALIEKKEKLLELLAEKRSALINQAVTKGLDPNVPMKDSGIPWIGEIPEHWDLTRLGLLTKRIGDGLHGTPQYDDDGDFWFINGTNLRNGSIKILEKTRSVNEEQWRAHAVALGRETILLSINGTVGNVARYQGEPVMLGKSAAYINCEDELNRNFLFYYLQTSCAQTYYQLESPGTTVLNLSLESIRRFPLPLPSRIEQAAICASLGKELEQLDTLVTNCETSTKKLKEYRQSLITAAVTGQLEIPAEDYE